MKDTKDTKDTKELKGAYNHKRWAKANTSTNTPESNSETTPESAKDNSYVTKEEFTELKKDIDTLAEGLRSYFGRIHHEPTCECNHPEHPELEIKLEDECSPEKCSECNSEENALREELWEVKRENEELNKENADLNQVIRKLKEDLAEQKKKYNVLRRDNMNNFGKILDLQKELTEYKVGKVIEEKKAEKAERENKIKLDIKNDKFECENECGNEHTCKCDPDGVKHTSHDGWEEYSYTDPKSGSKVSMKYYDSRNAKKSEVEKDKKADENMDEIHEFMNGRQNLFGWMEDLLK